MAKQLAVKDFDYVEFYVGNAKQAAHYYRAVFGFDIVAYRGAETGVKDRASYLVQQGKIQFVLTSPLDSDSEISEHIKVHGDGVKDVAFEVTDAKQVYEEALKRGAKSAYEPIVLKDEQGEMVKAAIKTFGDTIHSFVERKNYKGAYFPQFVAKSSSNGKHLVKGKFAAIDHIVGNVGWNEMDHWAKFYEDVFGFHQLLSFDDKDISTEFTSLRSKVMANDSERIKMPINEPAQGKKKSQIEEYIQFYGGAGVQHVAMLTDDILTTVQNLRAQGVEFISVPEAYYGTVLDRVGTIKEELALLKKESILVDKDEHGYMLQTFTKPVEDRPTLFYEVIQRRGSKSFGKGNFRALFEAIERDQAERGNL